MKVIAIVDDVDVFVLLVHHWKQNMKSKLIEIGKHWKSITIGIKVVCLLVSHNLSGFHSTQTG